MAKGSVAFELRRIVHTCRTVSKAISSKAALLRWSTKVRGSEVPKEGFTVCQAAFGERSRYLVQAFLSRDLGEGRKLVFYVTDAEMADPFDGVHRVVRQTPTLVEALDGLL